MESFLIAAAVAISVIAAVRPFTWRGITFSMVSVPLACVVVLFCIGVLPLEVVSGGLTGSGTIMPWKILIIFFTVSYVSISVDLSGILDYFAFRIVRLSGGNGYVLFFFFYIFASILTVFTSNDIVILTLTPIIFYLNKHADINVIPLLFAEFFGANTLSMLLFIGNPTNIIIGSAVGLSFYEYSRIMTLPSLAAALVQAVLLFFLFRRRITRQFSLRENSRVDLRSISDAVISFSLLLMMLVLLLLSEYVHLEIYQITGLFCFAYIIEDLGISLFHIARNPARYITELSSDMKEIYALYGFHSNRYDFFVIMNRIPWKILPFIVSVFILVNGLVYWGAVGWLAGILGSLSQSVWSAVFVNGIAGFLLSNIINNQPASILYSYILTDPLFSDNGLITTASAFAVIAASNLGANLTLIGALAGIMWERILNERGVKISYIFFLKQGVLITPVVFLLTLCMLYFFI